MSKRIIFTETSLYYLNQEDNTVTRIPGFGTGTDPKEVTESVLASLRRDNEPVSLHEIYACEEGSPLTMLIQVREDDIPTLRITTNIRKIIEVYDS